MRANLDAQRGYVLAEPAMLALAARVGKHRAHELVHRAALAGQEPGVTLAEALARRPGDRRRAAGRRRRCCAPERALGAASALIDAVLAGDEPEPPPEGYLGARRADPQRSGAGARRRRVRARARRRAAARSAGSALADIAHVRRAADAIPRRRPRARCSTRCSDCSTRRRRTSTRATATSSTSASARCEQRVGDAAGWLNAGRPRREAGRIAFRIALRDRLLDLAAGDRCASPRRWSSWPRASATR